MKIGGCSQYRGLCRSGAQGFFFAAVVVVLGVVVVVVVSVVVVVVVVVVVLVVVVVDVEAGAVVVVAEMQESWCRWVQWLNCDGHGLIELLGLPKDWNPC